MSRVPNTVVVRQVLVTAWPRPMTCAEVVAVVGLTLEQVRRSMTELSSQGQVVPCSRPDVRRGWAWGVQR